MTATYGFRHSDSIDASIAVFRELAKESGVLEIVNTEDVSLLTAENLRNYDAVYFFTSGELPLSDQQKADLLDFVRSGKGFGGSHSATDCLYTWPEYGELIGGYFDGHPWAQEAAVDVEDAQSPLVAGAAPAFRFIEEFYQFRNFSRDRVRVLLTLDTRSVDMKAAGINRTDGDFPLAWMRNYGQGRVFYSAFGHFPDSFRLAPVRTHAVEGATVADGRNPGRRDAAVGPFRRAAGDRGEWRGERGGKQRWVRTVGHRGDHGGPADERVQLRCRERSAAGAPGGNARRGEWHSRADLRGETRPGDGAIAGESCSRSTCVAGGFQCEPVECAVPLRIEAADPSILAASRFGDVLVVYLTGLGGTDPPVREGIATPVSPLARTLVQPQVLVGGVAVPVVLCGTDARFCGVVSDQRSTAERCSFEL